MSSQPAIACSNSQQVNAGWVIALKSHRLSFLTSKPPTRHVYENKF